MANDTEGKILTWCESRRSWRWRRSQLEVGTRSSCFTMKKQLQPNTHVNVSLTSSNVLFIYLQTACASINHVQNREKMIQQNVLWLYIKYIINKQSYMHLGRSQVNINNKQTKPPACVRDRNQRQNHLNQCWLIRNYFVVTPQKFFDLTTDWTKDAFLCGTVRRRSERSSSHFSMGGLWIILWANQM